MDLKEKILVALGLDKEETKLGFQAKSDDGTIFVSTAESSKNFVTTLSATFKIFLFRTPIPILLSLDRHIMIVPTGMANIIILYYIGNF